MSTADRAAVWDLTAAPAAGNLRYPIAARVPLDEILRAHRPVERARHDRPGILGLR